MVPAFNSEMTATEKNVPISWLPKIPCYDLNTSYIITDIAEVIF